MKTTKAIEYTLNALFCAIRADLEERFCRKAGKAAVAVDDLVGRAYEYVCFGVLNGRVALPTSKAGMRRLVAAKAVRLLKDARRALGSEHGRRSLRVQRSLDEASRSQDEAQDEGASVLMDAASYARYADGLRAEERAYVLEVAVKTMHRVFEKIGMTTVNRKIYLECVMGEEPRDVVAKKYGTTRNNADAIVARGKRALAKYGPEIFAAIYNKAA